MIRIAHISDSHWDERGRLQDVVDVHRAFIDQARERDVNLIVHSGDWFERRSTPAERLAVADFLEAARDIAPVFGVKGNHDAELDLSIFPRLNVTDDDQSLVIYDRPTAAPGSAEVYELDEPFDDHAPRLGLLALPWFDKAHLVSQLEASVDQEETRERTIAAAQNLLTCLRAEATRLRGEGIVPILVAHVLVAGSEISSGQTLIGTTVEIAPQDLLDVGAAYAAIGHVHKTQTWFDGRVAYAGSPHRCNFGEPEAKGWRLVTLDDDGGFLYNDFVELPARRIVRLELDYTEESMRAALLEDGIHPNFFGLDVKRDVSGALVRFRYRIRPSDLHLVQEDLIASIFRADGAEEVRMEAVLVQEARARVPEIVEVQTTAEKVDAYLRAKGIDVGPAQVDRLHQKLGILEGGAW